MGPELAAMGLLCELLPLFVRTLLFCTLLETMTCLWLNGQDQEGTPPSPLNLRW